MMFLIDLIIPIAHSALVSYETAIIREGFYKILIGFNTNYLNHSSTYFSTAVGFDYYFYFFTFINRDVIFFSSSYDYFVYLCCKDAYLTKLS